MVFGASCHAGGSHSDGYAVGTLINVRDQGLVWDRPMVTLLHVGEMKADANDDFALDDGLLQRAQDFSAKNERVRVQFVQRYVCWSWNYAKCDIITDIQPDVPATPTETTK